ncbi:hypothetical protein ANCDUO_13491 [Ancylostoma duodenale]|uniref:Uncharacterized protein n=1 Tax=Ancylostoma duodenale TaxID=51022 RepID=A0A0C2CIT7_9BILA|nr:hypothetical protein ANCDUO_13491 [Ancylostoma duodenale]
MITEGENGVTRFVYHVESCCKATFLERNPWLGDHSQDICHKCPKQRTFRKSSMNNNNLIKEENGLSRV